MDNDLIIPLRAERIHGISALCLFYAIHSLNRTDVVIRKPHCADHFDIHEIFLVKICVS